MYKVVLEQAKAAPADAVPKLVDVGCCMGTDLRRLLLDGYPSDRSSPTLIGCDLRAEFIQCGHELYQDGPTSDKPVPITFFQSDLFDERATLFSLKGQANYIHTAMVFHLFDQETQLKMAERLVDLLGLPERIDGIASNREYIVFGRHDGRDQEQALESRLGGMRYVHSPRSWMQMWNDILTKRYGEEWVKSKVKQEAFIAGFHTVKEDEPLMPVYYDLQWSVRISI